MKSKINIYCLITFSLLIATIISLSCYSSPRDNPNDIVTENPPSDPGTPAPNSNWAAVASNPDGTKLFALNYSTGRVWASTNSGSTWVERGIAVSSPAYWNFLASSADGTKLVASSSAGIWISTDGGNTWNATNAGAANWTQVRISNNGLMLAAINDPGSCNPYPYTSSDGGATWTLRNGGGKFISIATSSDGMTLFAGSNGGCDSTGYLSISTNQGANWTQQTTPGAHNWQSVACSSDGTKLVGCMMNQTSPTYIYTSPDGGGTWNLRSSMGDNNWTRVTISDDGQRLTVLENVDGTGDYNIWYSSDSGASWLKSTNPGTKVSWWRFASSSNGLKLIMCEGTGNLWTSTDGGANWIQR